MTEERLRRIAANESRFRQINERLEEDLRQLPVDDDPVTFVCECGSLACAEPVSLTISEFEKVRQDPHLFAVRPGHEIPDAEDVVVREERYVVVRKHVEVEELVEETDLRS